MRLHQISWEIDSFLYLKTGWQNICSADAPGWQNICSVDSMHLVLYNSRVVCFNIWKIIHAMEDYNPSMLRWLYHFWYVWYVWNVFALTVPSSMFLLIGNIKLWLRLISHFFLKGSTCALVLSWDLSLVLDALRKFFFCFNSMELIELKLSFLFSILLYAFTNGRIR